MTTGLPPAAAGPIPGLLSPGTYAINIVRSGTSSAGLAQGTGSVAVRQIDDDTVEAFDLSPDQFELVLTTAGIPNVSPAVLLKELVINGIYFPAQPPVLWRPIDPTGQVQPGSWQWTLHSSNGGVTVRTYSSAQPATQVHLESGQLAEVQQVITTMYFGGTASGSLDISHWEVIGDSNQMFEMYSGTLTFLGSTTRVAMMLRLGTLAGHLRY